MYAFERTAEGEGAVQEYELVLQTDVNSKGSANWFYFKVLSKKPKTIKLRFLNLQKSFSFFGGGMRPAVFSLRKYKAKGVQWQYDGYELGYQRNNIPKDSDTRGCYNTLTMTIEITQPDEVLYIASC